MGRDVAIRQDPFLKDLSRTILISSNGKADYVTPIRGKKNFRITDFIIHSGKIKELPALSDESNLLRKKQRRLLNLRHL
ncbi:hypothetical protein LEP1GSC060_3163 [Leptospira weilii serovar Ranarum str. ICFT]|uniref:Uncharacterized protein n=1 Tax=Leptospira weilii serovar Ranarum str. ICFT TaxID=1218598 RepID=N1WI97_9LEPT|nr:hypothetical protein LEP1GSC060_3163 [Leptospira weilii serovar Ranarum str. ICFT]